MDAVEASTMLVAEEWLVAACRLRNCNPERTEDLHWRVVQGFKASTLQVAHAP